MDGSAVVRFARNVARRLASNDLGQDLVELTMVTPIMLLVVFGIIEFGSILDSQQAMSHLTREGANIASRGAPLDTVLAVTLRNGADIELDTRGGAVVSRVLVEGGVPNVDYQVASAGYAGASQLGNPGDPVMAGLNLAEGVNVYVVEVFYDRPTMTPVQNFFSGSLPSTMYDRAVF